jgi:beta-glucosidase
MFPAGFVWGAASSAYQIEGGATADGRGLSNWDVFCRTPGAIKNAHTGDQSTDHYHKHAADVALMKQIGLRAYRFSLSWSRILPAGDASRGVNQAGLAFYDRLVDDLLAAGIEPWATLFHWDFPYELSLRGGWLNADSPKWFADYAVVVADRLSDRVSNWMTINEPQIYIGHGHIKGDHAPGLKLPACEWLRAAHHTLLAHGRAVQVLRARCKKKPRIGWAVCARTDIPFADDAGNVATGDVSAARNRFFSVSEPDAWNNAWWADAACLGAYPDDGLELFGHDVPEPEPGDMETIAQPLDFYGVNIYSAERYRVGPDGHPEHVPWDPGVPTNAMRWPIAPSALYWAPRFLHERYKLPIYITENGYSGLDWVHPDGKVHDPQRTDYTRSYLRELARAARDGIDVRGYFHWSILDNFEWAEGYKERFGLIHVDYRTLKRTFKESAHWYRRVIDSNGAALA